MNVPRDRSLTSWIRELDADGRLYVFYKTPEWRSLRAEVLRDSHYECQICASRGKYTRAQTVHHVNEVKRKPWLALSRTYIEDGERKPNLIALCNTCHNEVHDRKLKGTEPKPKGFTNEERW